MTLITDLIIYKYSIQFSKQLTDFTRLLFELIQGGDIDVASEAVVKLYFVTSRRLHLLHHYLVVYTIFI